MSGFNSPAARSLMIALLFAIPDHWLLPQSRDLKKAAGRDDSFSQLGGLLLRVPTVSLSLKTPTKRSNPRPLKSWSQNSTMHSGRCLTKMNLTSYLKESHGTMLLNLFLEQPMPHARFTPCHQRNNSLCMNSLKKTYVKGTSDLPSLLWHPLSSLLERKLETCVHAKTIDI